MTNTPRGSVVVMLFTLVACGPQDLAPDDVRTTEQAATVASKPGSGEQCTEAQWVFVGWNSTRYVTVGALQQGAPKLASQTFEGTMRFKAFNNPTPNPSSVTLGATQCTTTAGKLTISGSVGETLSAEVNVPPFKAVASGTVLVGGSVERTTSECVTTTDSQTLTIAPQGQLLCTIFDGVSHSKSTIERFHDDWHGTRHCKEWRASVICVPGVRYTDCVDGTGVMVRVEAPSLVVEATTPMSTTRCDANAYPTSPF